MAKTIMPIARLAAAAVAATLWLTSAAQALYVISPSGESGIFFTWTSPIGTDFKEPVFDINSELGSTAQITVPTASLIDIIIGDPVLSQPGDAFEIELNGSVLTPTGGALGPNTRGPGATSFFLAEYDGVFLPAGVNTFEIFVTDACCDEGGSEILSFTNVRAAPPQSGEVPLPAALPLLAAAFGGLGLLRLRKAG